MDYSKLGAQIKAKRERDNLTLRQAAEQSGISCSALSQIEHGRRHYLYGETLSRLLEWLGAVSYVPQKPMPEIVDRLLLLDMNISADGMVSIADTFRKAYEAMTA